MTIARRFAAVWLFLLATGLAFSQTTPQPEVPTPAGTSTPPAPAPATSAPPSAAQSDSIDSSKADDATAPKAGNTKPDKTAKKMGDKGDDNGPLVKKDKVHNPVLWTDPGNIAEKDLYYGQGGEKHLPKPPFTFVEEDLSGSNPKFDAKDGDGKKWRVKLEEEARPEVVASRLLWAVGYFANDDYVLPEATVSGLNLRRKATDRNGEQVTFARFERKPEGEDKLGTWDWADNPFTGTREFNGLRVMMAVMNNWDLKNINNSVYEDKKNDRQIYLANDIGATFGTNGISWGRARSKGNLKSFQDSKFVTRETPTDVDFATPAAAGPYLALFEWHGYDKRLHMEWIGRNIPRADARWMGSLLAQLSHQQLVDAFRAGGFPPDMIDAYVHLVEGRIAELKGL